MVVKINKQGYLVHAHIMCMPYDSNRYGLKSQRYTKYDPKYGSHLPVVIMQLLCQCHMTNHLIPQMLVQVTWHVLHHHTPHPPTHTATQLTPNTVHDSHSYSTNSTAASSTPQPSHTHCLTQVSGTHATPCISAITTNCSYTIRYLYKSITPKLHNSSAKRLERVHVKRKRLRTIHKLSSQSVSTTDAHAQLRVASTHVLVVGERFRRVCECAQSLGTVAPLS